MTLPCCANSTSTLVPIPIAEPGSYEQRATTYRSLESFLRERPERLHSRERDIGLRWHQRGALYRAAWIRDTGELYLVQLGPADEGGGHVELLASGISAAELDEALCGWRRAHDDGESSLDWLRDRVGPLARSAKSIAAVAA